MAIIVTLFLSVGILAAVTAYALYTPIPKAIIAIVSWRPRLQLEAGWEIYEVRKQGTSAIALVTLKCGDSQTVFTRVDVGKGWPLDPIPAPLDRKRFGDTVSELFWRRT